MNGPEHYQHSEDHLASAETAHHAAAAATARAADAVRTATRDARLYGRYADDTAADEHRARAAAAASAATYHLAAAQAHATLALAAATAPAEGGAWLAAVTTRPGEGPDEDPRLTEDYDPGPECDDQGGMSEYRYTGADDDAWQAAAGAYSRGGGF